MSDTNTFIARIVLHGVDHDAEPYGMLHTEMRNRSFRRSIALSDTVERYHLPPAEYFYSGAAGRRFVLGLASEAVRAIGWQVGPEAPGRHTASVLVTQSAGITFDGLTALVDGEDV